MNIIAICGSPRIGNTEFVLRRFLLKAEELGHKAELVLLREKHIEHCSGCFTCDNPDLGCPQRDDMKPIVERLQANDLIVFASPVYFSNVTGSMKVLFDRLQPLYVSGALQDKKAVAIAVGASKNITSGPKAIETIVSLAEHLKMGMAGDFILVGREPHDIEKDPESVQKIDDFAKNILS
jgi:multimeric flavodoxin WrbA